MAELLRAEGITKKYGSFTALNNVSMSADEGEFVCLLGPSGCGKTTLLRIIAGLEKATEGKIYRRRGCDPASPQQKKLRHRFPVLRTFPELKGMAEYRVRSEMQKDT